MNIVAMTANDVATYLRPSRPNKRLINPASRDLLAVASLLLRTLFLPYKDLHKSGSCRPMDSKGRRHPMNRQN